MPVTSSALLQGPADLYVGAFGAVEPAGPNASPSSAVWTPLGSTNGGTTLSFATSYSQLTVDQTLMAPESVPTEVTSSVSTTLAETTLENLKVVLNGGTITTATGTKTFKPSLGTVGVAPTYQSILLYGRAPGGQKRLIIARKCLSTEGTETNFSKEDMSTYSVTFMLHYVSDSVSPVDWIDQTA